MQKRSPDDEDPQYFSTFPLFQTSFFPVTQRHRQRPVKRPKHTADTFTASSGPGLLSLHSLVDTIAH